MDLSTLANIGTLNSLNGSIPKDSSNPKLEPSYFVYHNKHNQWLRLLYFVDDMLFVGSNDAIKKEFEDSVRNSLTLNF
jgi:hypothetical protein